MTIRFLEQWNGNAPGKISTLAGGEETRLVNLGLASFDLDGEVGNQISSTAKLTQAAYDELVVKDPSTLYVIVG